MRHLLSRWYTPLILWLNFLVNVPLYMGVSKNNGTPKSSILIGFSIINHPFWGTPIFGNTHMVNCTCNTSHPSTRLASAHSTQRSFCVNYALLQDSLNLMAVPRINGKKMLKDPPPLSLGYSFPDCQYEKTHHLFQVLAGIFHDIPGFHGWCIF